MFADWYLELQKANDHVKVYCLRLLQKAAGGDWRAGAWLLEKLYPLEFGRHIDVSTHHQGSVEARIDLSKLTTEELWTLREIRRKLKGDLDE